nr:E3 ubiquitin-protein ligase siah2 [Helicoverpa armigera]
MGAEQSTTSRSNASTPTQRQMSQAEVERMLDQQRQQYERKLQEVVNKTKQEAAARPPTPQTISMERERAPYSYAGPALQQNAAPSTPQPLYPNLNQPQAYPYQPQPNNQFHPQPNNNQFHPQVNNNPFQPQRPNDFVFVNNFGQTESYNRPAPSAPFLPNRRGRGQGPRPRSISRQRNEPQERDVLDCPTCHSRFGLRIYQCDSGHSSCSECKNRGRVCGICRQVLTNRRNFDIENHMAQTKALCPNASEGCKLYIKISDMDTHLRECPFKEQECPLAAVFGTCCWRGKLSQIAGHFDQMHPSGRQTDVDTEMALTNVQNTSQEVHLVVLGTYNFLIHVKVSETDGKVYMAVQLIGTKFSAAKWNYEIHVYNKNEKHRKYTYTDNCMSSNDKVEDIFKDGECAVLPVWYANTFVHNGVMNYKFFIKKSEEAIAEDSKSREEKESRKGQKQKTNAVNKHQRVKANRGRSSSLASENRKN